jgi:hypothetical protein
LVYLFEKCCITFLGKCFKIIVATFETKCCFKKYQSTFLNTLPKNVDKKISATLLKKVDEKNIGNTMLTKKCRQQSRKMLTKKCWQHFSGNVDEKC